MNKCIIRNKTRDEIYPPPEITPSDGRKLSEIPDGKIVPVANCPTYHSFDNRPHLFSYKNITISPPCLKKTLLILAQIVKTKLLDPYYPPNP